MGQGGCTSLCSAVNSCTPLPGLITQVSLEIPATETPGGRGAGGRKKSSAMCAVSLLRSSANHHPRERFYWKEFISPLYQRCPSVYFPARGDCWGLTEAGKDYVTDKRLSSKIHRWQLSWISICVHIASISYFIWAPAPVFHLNSKFPSTGWYQTRRVCTKPQKRAVFPIICISLA